MAWKPENVKRVQRALNAYFKKYKVPTQALLIDGDIGRKTRDAVKLAKRCIGYAPKYADDKITEGFQERLSRPLWRRLLSPRQIARGLAFRRKLRADFARQKRSGTTIVDGHPVANWIVPILEHARKHGWHGVVWSGYRSDALQAQLYAVYVNCGFCSAHIAAPPGQSRHRFKQPYLGAVDVSDRDDFQQAIRSWPGPGHLHPFGSGDPPHFSDNGH